MFKLHPALNRLNEYILRIDNPQGVDAHIFANQDVQIETNAVEELLGFLRVHQDYEGTLEKVVITPDFHKGRGIPIGTVALMKGLVLPQAIGTDIGCGVSLLITDLQSKDLEPHWPTFQTKLRYLFFQGGRDIPMSPEQRISMLCQGPLGLLENYNINAHIGLWQYYEPKIQAINATLVTSQPVTLFSPFLNYVEGSGRQDSRDAQIGSVGGGNHFVEIQEVNQLLGSTYLLDNKLINMPIHPGIVTIMVHTGSVSLGSLVGRYFVNRAREHWPKGAAKPKSGFYKLEGINAEEYLTAMWNAINFAACNRMFLGLMVIRALVETLGQKVQHCLLWDSPHNWISQEGNHYLHRKGACLAKKGKPVLIPGSMGDASYVLVGSGNETALNSACHGTGRQIARGKTLKQEELSKLKIVTAIDPNTIEIRCRPDILKKYHRTLAEEAPEAYKPSGPIIQTMQDADIASPRVKLRPLLTIKG